LGTYYYYHLLYQYISNAAGISPPAAVFRANTIRNDKEIIIE
jgi:hypothetical protein